MKKPRNRLLAIARKEFWHIIHDPRSLIIIFLLPAIQVTMFGYALNLEIQKVDMAVLDYSGGTQARHLIEEFSGSPFFEVFPFEGTLDHIENYFLTRQARVVLIIPQDFDRSFRRKGITPVQLLIDAVDPNAAINVKIYCNQIITRFNEHYGGYIPLPFEVRSTIWFNPDLKSTFFFVPGLMALILVMISAMLTSITIVREKEMGTLEQILVSPIRPPEIIIGKVLPYIFIALLDGFIILILGITFFDVPFMGNFLLFILLTLLYVTTALSLGLMISTVARTQIVAMMMALVITLLPTLILSGFIFPIPSMPRILQYISYLIPAKYYLFIVRGIMLKGNSFWQLANPALFLAIMSGILLLVAWRRFRINLEK